MDRLPHPSLRHPLSVRLPRTQERFVYWLASGVVLTGVLWLLFQYFVQVEGEFGPEPHRLQIWWLRLHGALSLWAVWGFGALWTVHIRRAWQSHRHRRSGGLLFTGVTLLAATGLLLYYSGSDRVRALVSVSHWLIGLGSTGVLLAHILIARRSHGRRSADAP